MNIFNALFVGRPEPLNTDEMFRLKVSDAYGQYQDLQKELCKDAQVDVLFRYVRSLPKGAAGGFSERKANDQLDLIRIVSAELAEYDEFASMREDMADDVIPGSDVVRHILMQRHEVEHAKQVSWLRAGAQIAYFTEVQFGDDYAKTGNMYMGLLRVSERLNPFWYQGKDEKPKTVMNYWSNPLEIMSERASIEDGPKLLKEMFPGVSTQDCESAVLDYVDRQCFDTTILGIRVPRKYFIQLPSDWRLKGMSVDDVLKMFDEACRKGWERPAKYRLEDLKGDKDCREDHFAYAAFVLCEDDEDGSFGRQLYDRFMKQASDLRDSVMVMGTVACMDHSVLLEQYKTLDNAKDELHPDVVFYDGCLNDFLEYCRTHGEAARAAKAAQANEQLSRSGVSDVVPVLTPEERRARLAELERKDKRRKLERDAVGTVQGSAWVEREVGKPGTSVSGPELPGRKDGGPDYT